MPGDEIITIPETGKDALMVLNPNHKISYKTIVDILKDSYNFDENVTSTSLDILALYLKGQKIIYTESKTFCEKRLNSLMLPAIFISAVCSILSFILKDYPFGMILISALNALNSFILSVINYLKLSEKSQNHLMAAQRFHNLEAKLELESGRSLFFNESIDIQETLKEMEKEIKDIQNGTQFIIPEEIRHRFPRIYATNVFAIVKRIKNDEMIIFNELKNAVQQIHYYTDRRDNCVKREEEQNVKLVNMRNHMNHLELQIKLLALECSVERNIVIDPKEIEKQELDRTLENPEKNREYVQKQVELAHYEIGYKTEIDRLAEIRGEYNHALEQIHKKDKEKNIIFEKSINHRQQYNEMNDIFNREINKNIESSKRCRSCNPCSFFNT